MRSVQHTQPEVTVSRVQLALNVGDIDSAVDFYAAFFGVPPAKRRRGYANFEIPDPPLKLVLIETADTRGHGTAGALNHLGIEVESSDEVRERGARLEEEGLEVVVEDAITCCFAVQDKAWVHDRDGLAWEVYTVLADAPSATGVSTGCC
jgi:catechol 2,3-dioxygenase-like lactoylglutathione lyase family enzyme